jgi:hypothetical protein
MQFKKRNLLLYFNSLYCTNIYVVTEIATENYELSTVAKTSILSCKKEKKILSFSRTLALLL